MSIIDSQYKAEENDQFAQSRSHEASKISYDIGKASSQAALLINGGAATAVLALLAKEHVQLGYLHAVAVCLAVYAIGVASGAVMMFCVMRMAENWNYFWYHMSYTGNESEGREHETRANNWDKFARCSFGTSIACFIISSVAISIALGASN